MSGNINRRLGQHAASGRISAQAAAAAQRYAVAGSGRHLVDLHGDVVGTLPVADGAGEASWAGLELTAFDEFGAPAPLTPVNCTDLEGTWPSFKSILNVVAKVAEVASIIPGPIGAASAGVRRDRSVTPCRPRSPLGRA